MDVNIIGELAFKLQRVMIGNFFSKLSKVDREIVQEVQNTLAIAAERETNMYGMLESHKRTYADIYAYFNYDQGYGSIPIEDMCDYVWVLECDNEQVSFYRQEEGEVEKSFDEVYDKGENCAMEVVKVYEREYFTACITQNENMEYFFTIFDNVREHEWDDNDNLVLEGQKND
jgi:hypothetical protein